MLLEKEEIGLVFHYEIEWYYATILPIVNFTKCQITFDLNWIGLLLLLTSGIFEQ